jgi:putative multiple sugar transport system substrate-binding protein
MPTKELQRWNQDGDNMKKALEEAGYAVDLQYANDDVATQVSQIENMITSGCDYWLSLPSMVVP